MASITKRGRFWRAQVRRRGQSTSRTFDTKAEAEAWSQDIEREIRRSEYVDRSEAEQTTLKDALDRYEREVTSRKRGASRERSRIRRWLRHELASRPLPAIRSADLAEYRDGRLDEGAAAKTVREELQLLRHMFKTAALDWGLPVSNPVEKLRLPSQSQARDRRLTEVEYRHLVASACAQDYRARVPIAEIVVLAVETAMRRGEIVALRWEHIDFTDRTAHLPHTKNGHARTIPLSPVAIGALRQLVPAGTDALDELEGPVLPGITADGVTQAFQLARDRGRDRYIESCSTDGIVPDRGFLLDVRFHDLRHEATSRLARVYQPHELARVTGHRTLQMVMRYYHPTASELAARLG
ncbi:MAG TPA: site-specific integrase [Guyparkeria sp.]|nr:site-specific integrase [Guyparkeria sp.]